MSDRPAVSPTMPKRIGIAANHGGFALKDHLVGVLQGLAQKRLTLATAIHRFSMMS